MHAAAGTGVTMSAHGSDTLTARDADFSSYMHARQASLLRTAYLLTGDRPTAEDLVQVAFAKLYLAWDKVSESPELTKQYLEEWVYGVNDRDEYWEKLGADKHKHLEVPQNMSHPINYGKY